MHPTAEQHATFATNGVVKIAGAVDSQWFAPLLELADAQLASPGDWVSDSNPGATVDRLFTTRYLWPTNEIVRRFAMESGVAGIVGELLDTDSVRLYFDHMLIKEPATAAPTPWHQDIPYWPFLGSKIASALSLIHI